MKPDLGLERILEKNIGERESVISRLHHYRKLDKEGFAVIKISGQCIDSDLERLSGDIADLFKAGLRPVITYGWEKRLAEKLKSAHIESKFIDGERYTDEKVMNYVLNIAQEMQDKLFACIQSKGAIIEKIGLEQGVLLADEINDQRFGPNNGKISHINAVPILNAVYSGIIPIVSPIGLSLKKDKYYNVNSAAAGVHIALIVKAERYVLVTETGGVLDENKQLINEISVPESYNSMVKSGVLNGGMRINVDEAIQFLKLSKHAYVSAQIISPLNILQCFFGSKNSCTNIKMQA